MLPGYQLFWFVYLFVCLFVLMFLFFLTFEILVGFGVSSWVTFCRCVYTGFYPGFEVLCFFFMIYFVLFVFLVKYFASFGTLGAFYERSTLR